MVDINDKEYRKLQTRLKELEASENRYRTLVESFDDFVFMFDCEHQLLSINAAGARVLGKKAKELLGKNLRELFPPEVSQSYQSQIDKILASGQTYKSEESPMLVGDKMSWVNVILTPLRDESGKVIAVSGVSRDVTRRKHADKQILDDKLLLEQKNMALNELLEHMERTKIKIKDDIAINVERIVIPTLKKLELKGVPRKYIELVYHQLGQLVSSFGRKITDSKARLSPREIELCGLLKDGLTSKEISELLKVSYKTIDKHRRNIRKKLGISKKKVNLTSFLTKL